MNTFILQKAEADKTHNTVRHNSHSSHNTDISSYINTKTVN